jgi:hypothetical protein
MQLIIFLIITIIVYPNVAYAYLGPGLGGGLFATVIGILIAFFIGLFAIVYFPIKKIFLKLKNKKKEKIISEQEKDINNK